MLTISPFSCATSVYFLSPVGINEIIQWRLNWCDHSDSSSVSKYNYAVSMMLGDGQNSRSS